MAEATPMTVVSSPRDLGNGEGRYMYERTGSETLVINEAASILPYDANTGEDQYTSPTNSPRCQAWTQLTQVSPGVPS